MLEREKLQVVGHRHKTREVVCFTGGNQEKRWQLELMTHVDMEPPTQRWMEELHSVMV